MIRFELQIRRILGHTIEVQRQPSGVRTCQVISHLPRHSNCGQQCRAVDPPSSSDTCDAELCKFSASLLTPELHSFHRHPCTLSNLNMAEPGVFFSNGHTWNHPSVMTRSFRKWNGHHLVRDIPSLGSSQMDLRISWVYHVSICTASGWRYSI